MYTEMYSKSAPTGNRHFCSVDEWMEIKLDPSSELKEDKDQINQKTSKTINIACINNSTNQEIWDVQLSVCMCNRYIVNALGVNVSDSGIEISRYFKRS